MERIFINDYNNIIILSGAGVSVQSGLPTYRNGNFFLKHSTMNSLEKDLGYIEFKAMVSKAEPNLSHTLAKHLYESGRLRRVYTQNVDGLYQKAGLPDEMVVEFHGSVYRNNIVLYGMKIEDYCIEMVIKDFDQNVDLIIVMGTALQVGPFCALPNLVRCPRIIVNTSPTDLFHNSFCEKNIHSWTKFGKRKVTLRPTWHDRKRNKIVHIIKSDCVTFSEQLIKHL